MAGRDAVAVARACHLVARRGDAAGGGRPHWQGRSVPGAGAAGAARHHGGKPRPAARAGHALSGAGAGVSGRFPAPVPRARRRSSSRCTTGAGRCRPACAARWCGATTTPTPAIRRRNSALTVVTGNRCGSARSRCAVRRTPPRSASCRPAYLIGRGAAGGRARMRAAPQPCFGAWGGGRHPAGPSAPSSRATPRCGAPGTESTWWAMGGSGRCRRAPVRSSAGCAAAHVVGRGSEAQRCCRGLRRSAASPREGPASGAMCGPAGGTPRRKHCAPAGNVGNALTAMAASPAIARLVIGKALHAMRHGYSRSASLVRPQGGGSLPRTRPAPRS